MLKDFDIKPILFLVQNPKANALVERVYQVIIDMLVTKYFDNKLFNYIESWGETLAYIAWEIRSSYHRTITAMPGKSVFGRDMLFNLASVVY